MCTSISLHPCSQTNLDYGSSSAYTHQSPALCLECVWIVDLCLCTHIRLQLCSNTFDFGCLFVYPPARTKLKVTPKLGRFYRLTRYSCAVFCTLADIAPINRVECPSCNDSNSWVQLQGWEGRSFTTYSTQGVELFFRCSPNVVSVSFPAAAICPEPDVLSTEWLRHCARVWSACCHECALLGNRAVCDKSKSW